MPSAPDWLRDRFPGGDREALDILDANFVETAGMFRKKEAGYVPTVREWEAIDYLFREWDYAYEE